MSSFVERLRQGQEPQYEARIRAATADFFAMAAELEGLVFSGAEPLLGNSMFISQLRTSAEFVERFLPHA